MLTRSLLYRGFVIGMNPTPIPRSALRGRTPRSMWDATWVLWETGAATVTGPARETASRGRAREPWPGGGDVPRDRGGLVRVVPDAEVVALAAMVVVVAEVVGELLLSVPVVAEVEFLLHTFHFFKLNLVRI